MKRASFLGWLGAIFGSLGTLICIGALIGVWIISAQLSDSVGQVLSRVSNILTQVREGSEEITARFEASRDDIRDLDQRIEIEIEKLAENADVSPEELEQLTAQARLIVRRSQDWLAFANSAREFSALAEEIIRSAVIFFRSDDQTMENIRISLENGQQQIEEAVAAFDELTTQLENLRENREPKVYPEKMNPLVNRIDLALGRVQEHTTEFTAGVTRFDETLDSLGAKIRRKIFWGTVLVSLLIAWQGAGQICLARSGSARIK